MLGDRIENARLEEGSAIDYSQTLFFLEGRKMQNTGKALNIGYITVLVSALLMASMGLCACSSNEQQVESASSSSEASSGRIALNDNTSDASVSLEKASVTVYNASSEDEGGRSIEGLADYGARKLQELGVERVTAKNAAMPGGFVSYIAYRSPRYEQAAHEIADRLGIKGPVHETEGKSSVGYSYDGDIALILCEDWAFSEGLVGELSERAQQAIDQYGDIVTE